MNGMNFIWALKGFTVEELDHEYQNILRSFFQQIRIGHKYIYMGLKYLVHFKRLFYFLYGYIKAKLRSDLNGRRGILMRNT